MIKSKYSDFPSIVVGEFKYTLTDYRVEKYNLLTGEYIESGLEFKHDSTSDFQDLLQILWKNYNPIETVIDKPKDSTNELYDYFLAMSPRHVRDLLQRDDSHPLVSSIRILIGMQADLLNRLKKLENK